MVSYDGGFATNDPLSANNINKVLIQIGTLSGRPASAFEGVLFYATDTGLFYRDNGSTWDVLQTPLNDPAVGTPGYRTLDNSGATSGSTGDHGHVINQEDEATTKMADFDVTSNPGVDRSAGGGAGLPYGSAGRQRVAHTATAGTSVIIVGFCGEYISDNDASGGAAGSGFIRVLVDGSQKAESTRALSCSSGSGCAGGGPFVIEYTETDVDSSSHNYDSEQKLVVTGSGDDALTFYPTTKVVEVRDTP